LLLDEKGLDHLYQIRNHQLDWLHCHFKLVYEPISRQYSAHIVSRIAGVNRLMQYKRTINPLIKKK